MDQLWCMNASERQKLNVFEMKCLRSVASVSRLYRLKNEGVRERTGVKKELAARGDMNILRCFGYAERMHDKKLEEEVDRFKGGWEKCKKQI